jgi:parallel beta-helix repeat protein
VVTGNDVRGNQIGIWMASASRNVISLNDGRNNSLTGLLFLNNINGPASDANVFILNEGSRQGVSGNQGVLIQASRE